jgi:hypothetical protein
MSPLHPSAFVACSETALALVPDMMCMCKRYIYDCNMTCFCTESGAKDVAHKGFVQNFVGEASSKSFT